MRKSKFRISRGDLVDLLPALNSRLESVLMLYRPFIIVLYYQRTFGTTVKCEAFLDSMFGLPPLNTKAEMKLR